MILQKPTISDLTIIEDILKYWTDPEEANKYVTRIQKEIEGLIEFNTHFWVIQNKHKTVGITGISNTLPKIQQFVTLQNPIELKLLYLDKKTRGLGLGKLTILELEKILKENNYDEILIRSAVRYKDTAWGFYEKMGFTQVGFIDQDMAVFRKILTKWNT